MAKLASRSGMLGRRSFLRKTACAALYGAAAPALHLLSAPANAAPNWRGLVGCIKPTVNNSSLVEMIRLLPPGIGVVPVFLNLTEGSREEMRNSYASYEKNIAYLASLGILLETLPA
jgi:hypothetical protein